MINAICVLSCLVFSLNNVFKVICAVICIVCHSFYCLIFHFIPRSYFLFISVLFAFFKKTTIFYEYLQVFWCTNVFIFLVYFFVPWLTKYHVTFERNSNGEISITLGECEILKLSDFQYFSQSAPFYWSFLTWSLCFPVHFLPCERCF